MASSYLGPESPRPLSVISESYQNQWNLPEYPLPDRFNFGPKYEENIVKLIHKYLELGTTDKLCYVGDFSGSLAPMIEERFCLLEPIMTILPGHVRYLETDVRVIPVSIAHTGAEEYFEKKQERGEKVRPCSSEMFDKVILKDFISILENPVAAYKNIMKCCGPYGKMLIIHRAGDLNTLPLFPDAKRRLGETDPAYENVLKDLYSCGLDVQWDIEHIPVRMEKTKWLTMMQQKFPPEMQVLSNFEIFSGVRDLSEGVLKYEGQEVEFLDRLLFITVSQPLSELTYPPVQKYGANKFRPFPNVGDVKMELEMTKDIKALVDLSKSDLSKKLHF